MKKKSWITVFSVLLFLTFSKAQHDVLLDERFIDNRNGWLLENSNFFKSEIKEGKLVMINNANARGMVSLDLKQDSFDELDYSIEINLSLALGKKSVSYGIVWGENQEGTDFYDFMVTGKNTMCVKQGSDFIRDWVKLGAIKAENNTLKIVKEGNQTHFYINGELVEHQPDLFLKGSKIGVIVEGKGTLVVNGLKVIKITDAINDIESGRLALERKKLGSQINSQYNELSPIVSPDGKMLCVVRSKHPDNIGGSADQDIWCSDLVNGEWTELVNIGSPVNNKHNNFLVSISPDNNHLEVGLGIGTGGIASSKKTKSGWSDPEKQKIEDYYNLGRSVSFYATSDNQRLLMAVTRTDGYGAKDLYVSHVDEDGEWGKPVNLGPVINSFGDEDTPFLAADNKTLYFSSSGHPGYGKLDIFVSQRLDDTWTNWSVPQNMGPVINSRDFEQGYMLDAKGEYAYFSVKGDIYQIRNPFKPEPVVLVYGKVLDSQTNKPMEVKINYYDLENDELLGEAISNIETGEYKIVLPYGKNYSFEANHNGFYAISENMDTRDLKEYTELEKNLILVPIKKGEVVQLNNNFFDLASAKLRGESKHELYKLRRLLRKNPDLKVEISGHTDDLGNDEINDKLSYDRALAVMEYLIDKGCNPEQMQVKGYGKHRPLVPNDSDENRAINRRVEMEIL